MEKEEAFRQLLKDYGKIIYKVSYLYAVDEENFKDLRQEILIRLWNGFAEFRGDAKLSSWIYRVSLNTCISYYRRYGPKGITLPLDKVGDLTAEENRKSEELREMYRLINRLDPLQKAIILLWLDEHSYEEIADIIGLPRNNIAAKLMRIKKKLNEMANQ